MITVEVYRSKRFLGRQVWRWRATHSNGHVMAHSGEAYTNRFDCIEAVTSLFGDRHPIKE